MSNTWNDGYVVDVNYTESAFQELTPAWLSMVCVLNGQPPIDPSKRLRYVELGCGNGLSSLIVAATCPQAEVWGVDFNPAHVERARSLAASAQLDNCDFTEASFEELARDRNLGPPVVDIVVLHGVYSWVSAENRRHIVDFLRDRLAPGGLVYVSYNLSAGWAATVPLRDALNRQRKTDTRRSDVALRVAVESLHQLADDGAASFPLGGGEQHRFEALLDADPLYAAHEYLGDTFSPMFFADVADDLARSKCMFVGSRFAADVVMDLRVTPGLKPVVQSTGDLRLREAICDLAINNPFRGDVFRRGLAPSTPGERRAWLDDLTLVPGGTDLDESTVVQVPAGPVHLDIDRYRPIMDHLAWGPISVKELRELTPFHDRPPADAFLAAVLLLSGRLAAPALTSSRESWATEPTGRLNRDFVLAARRGQPRGLLAAPASTSFIGVDGLTTLAIGEIWDGITSGQADALAEATLRRVAELGTPLQRDGNTVTDPAEALDLCRGAARQATTLTAGKFRVLGIE